MTTSKSARKYTTRLSADQIGHWKTPVLFNPCDWFGFIYCIHSLETSQFYWGKKQFWHGGKKKSKTFGKEMAWKSYTGSSTHLKTDIAKHGHGKFSFEIVDLYNTKGGLYHAEAFSQMASECMTTMLEDGETPRFYNRQVAAIRFVPKEAVTDRTKKYVKALPRRF